MLDKESQDPDTQYSGAEVDRTATGGAIYSYTLVHEPPAGYEAQAPYYLALVELDEGGLVIAQLTDIDGPVQIGDRVEMVTRKLTTDGSQGMIVYGYKFRPIL